MMVEYTDDYGLEKLGVGDQITDKFGSEDRDTISQLLRLGAETHHHTGLPVEDAGFGVGARTLTLTQGQTTGVIPAGVRVHYRFTVTIDGFESNVSDTFYVDTPSPVAAPLAPVLETSDTGGVLLPGNYYYVLTAYTGTNTEETRGLSPTYLLVPSGTATNTVTVTLPDLPDGADGFNVYRKKPGGVRYDYVTTIDMDVATPPSTFLDDGSIEEDCDRTIPAQNFTNTRNHVLVELDGDPLDSGDSWSLYRTYVEGDYIDSRIATNTIGATPVYEFDDLGAAGSGSPPAAGLAVSSPSRVLLTDATEVQGSLPLGNTAYPLQITFNFAGPLQLVQGSAVWTCEFPYAEILWCRAVLGRGSTPASDPVLVDINKGPSSATPSFSTIYTTQANRPSIDVGLMRGDRHVPDVVTLERGDMLTFDIDQVGGGTTPTDRDLTVSVFMFVYGFPVGVSYEDGLSGGVGGDFF